MSIGPKGRSALVERARGTIGTTPASTTAGGVGLKRITSEADLLAYLKTAQPVGNQGFGSGLFRGNGMMESSPTVTSDNSAAVTAKGASNAGTLPSRVSDTNVQVAGIDEPDIVKTDGTTIYFSREGTRFYISDFIKVNNCVRVNSVSNCTGVPVQTPEKGVTAVTAFPIASLGIASDAIPERGEMLLVKNSHILLVLSSEKITAYDVTNPAQPKKKWTNNLQTNTQIVAARLKDETMYLVTGTYLDTAKPCPIVPMMRGATSISIPCGDIWAPVSNEPVNESYSLFTIDPTTGEETRTTTILGDANNTTIYMSENNIYLAYRMQNAMEKVMVAYLKNGTASLLSSTTIERIRVIDGYDISVSSKMNEITNAIEKEKATLSANDRLRFENELENGMSKYIETHLRDTDSTTIVRIPLSTLTVASSGIVPGHLLNQFSLDEWNGNLRVAVTIGDQWGMAGGKMVNDLYVLDSTFKQLGSILDLGLTERIYAARMIGNRGYLVTFRQTDPFYVLDLSNAIAPKLTGELKIPGYSAYLEPLSETRVLGVGKEGGSVKVSLFDVSDPKNPKEISKYVLKDSWTDVENNHHAFLRDSAHSVFFISGGEGGYVLSYAGDTLTLKATVSGYQVKRAVYIDDILYIIGEENITALDETTWKEVKTLKLN
jgi:uncharacterized secreted protein with C-terminal beta-propeller domain